MDGDEVGFGDQIGAMNGLGAKAQMRNGARPGFFRIVDKVTLGIIIGLFADDLDRVLIGADCAIGAQTPEDRPDCFGRFDIKGRIVIETGVAYIVENADGEVILGLGFA